MTLLLFFLLKAINGLLNDQGPVTLADVHGFVGEFEDDIIGGLWQLGLPLDDVAE